MLKKKEIIDLTIEESEFGGKSYGYYEDIKVNLKGGIKGQKVKVYIKKVRGKKAEGQIREVIEKSPLESETACTHFGNCGGCLYQGVSYEKQIKMKEEQVENLFNKAGIEDFEYLPIEGSPNFHGYRNKMEFSFGDEEKGGPLTLGMHKKGRHYDIVTVNECNIMDEDFRKILDTILNYFKEKNISQYNTRSHKGYLRHLVVRKAFYTKEIFINLVTTTQMEVDLTDLVDSIKKLNLQGKIVGFMHTLNDTLADVVQSDETRILFGRDYIIEKLLGLQFRISTFSFFQTNSAGAEKLYSIVRDFVGNADNKTVFDLYCGTGTIGQITAQKAKKVIGIEIIEDAVDAANENAKLNGLDNCKFIAGDVKEKVKELNDKPDIIVLDPPRSGIHPKALQDIIDFDAEKIVYVSCNPKTLVIDLVELEKNGYKVEKVKAMDMFPHTGHVEAAILMTYCGFDKE